MASTADVDCGAPAPDGPLSRLPTGAKVFLILSAALLPLAIIAIIATLQTGHLADVQARARLRVAAEESARAIAIELVCHMTALRSAGTRAICSVARASRGYSPPRPRPARVSSSRIAQVA